MSDVVRELAVKLSLSTDEASVKKAEKHLDHVKDKLKEIAGTSGVGGVAGGLGNIAGMLGKFATGPAGIALAVAGVGAAVGEMGKKTADTAREMNKAATMTGIGFEKFQELAEAGEDSGVQLEGMTHSLGKLSRAMYEASQGSGQSGKAFKALGVKLTDAHGVLRPTDEVFADIADRFKEMPNGAKKTALAMEVFGRQGASMLPLLNKGSEGLRKSAEEAHEYGKIIGLETLHQAQQFKEAKKTLGDLWEGFEIQVGGQVIPILTDLVKGFSQWFKQNKALIGSGLGHFIRETSSGLKILGGVLELVGKMFKGVEDIIKELEGSVGGSSALAEFLRGVLSPVTTLKDALVDLAHWIQGKASSIGRALAPNAQAYDAAADAGKRFDLLGRVKAKSPYGPGHPDNQGWKKNLAEIAASGPTTKEFWENEWRGIQAMPADAWNNIKYYTGLGKVDYRNAMPTPAAPAGAGAAPTVNSVSVGEVKLEVINAAGMDESKLMGLASDMLESKLASFAETFSGQR